MKLDLTPYLVREGEDVDLKQRSTRLPPLLASKKAYKKAAEELAEERNSLQERLYTGKQHAVLVIFQGMDTAGKDGAIRHVMAGIDPLGCKIASFKVPTSEELAHDFLWRAVSRLPERGSIGIFNRSYYEELLVVKVHPSLLALQKLPDGVKSAALWHGRYRSINDFEAHLQRSGTQVIKIFLHLSKDEQLQRLLARIDDPEKTWKFEAGDLKERKHWDAYQTAYEECLRHTSTEHAPWYVVPADDKPAARLIIAHILLKHLRALNLEYPHVAKEQRKELMALRKKLTD